MHIVEITGVIGGETTEALSQHLLALKNTGGGDSSPLLFYFDSPGGQVDGIKELATLIKEAGRPTVAVIGNRCTSAAYWLASQCDVIWAISPLAEVGSVGVMVSYRKPSASFTELVGEEVTVYAPQSTLKNAQLEALKRGDTELLQKEILAPIADAFIADVVAGRGARLLDKGDALLSGGRMLYATEALGRGWIDKILGTRAALREELRALGNTQVSNTITPDAQPTQEEKQEGVQGNAQRENTTPVEAASVDTEEKTKKETKKEEQNVVRGAIQVETPMENIQGNPPMEVQEEAQEDSPEETPKETPAETPKETQASALEALQGTEDTSPLLRVAPVSGLGVLHDSVADFLAFAQQHEDDPRAIVERLRNLQ